MVPGAVVLGVAIVAQLVRSKSFDMQKRTMSSFSKCWLVKHWQARHGSKSEVGFATMNMPHPAWQSPFWQEPSFFPEGIFRAGQAKKVGLELEIQLEFDLWI
jgi:hypothetical protein